MATIFTPTTFSGALGPYAIDINDCMGDSVGIINANTNYCAAGVKELSATTTQLNTTVNNLVASTTGSGSVLQIATFMDQTPTNIFGGTSNIQQNTNLIATPFTLLQKVSNSKILIHLTGGRPQPQNGKYIATYFYIGLNGGSHTILGNIGNPAERIFHNTTGGTIVYPHNARWLYTPPAGLNTISLQVWWRSDDVANSQWNNATSDYVPIVITMTEITT